MRGSSQSPLCLARAGRVAGAAVLSLALAVPLAFADAPLAHAAGVPGDPGYLGSASTYAVLGAATVTNTGPSVLTGDLGVYPGIAAVGFGGPGLGTVSGATHVNDAEALAAQNELTAAYNVAANLPADPADLGTGDLTGSTFTAGVRSSASSILINGDVTLVGDADDVFVFQAGSSLTMGTGSRIRLSGEVQACNVYWQVGSSATLNANTTFVGTIMASESIEVLNASTVAGRLLAGAGSITGAVTLINNTVTVPQCTTSGGGSTPGTGGGSTPGTGGGTGSPAVGADGTGAAGSGLPTDATGARILPATGAENSTLATGSLLTASMLLAGGGLLLAYSKRLRLRRNS